MSSDCLYDLYLRKGYQDPDLDINNKKFDINDRYKINIWNNVNFSKKIQEDLAKIKKELNKLKTQGNLS
jgi:acyl-CoA-binding protein